jgi:ABC-type transport system involved in multi-copper enzyme maturation permease subunit
MTRLFSRFGLPLLTKELIEQSARRRTYVIRVVYAMVLFFIAFLVFYETLDVGARSPLAVLGSGRRLFSWLAGLGYAGIYLFMPAITCSVISQEKERASLQLLFLTRLGPWAIVFEKLLGRLVPMLGFLLLSLPLLGFAYTLGGISQGLLWTGLWMLVLAAIQMGTLALACSAFFRTTVGAFISSYIVAFLMLFGPGMFWMLVFLLGMLLGIQPGRLFGGNSGLSAAMMLLMMAPFFGFAWFQMLNEYPGTLGNWLVVAHSVVILSASAACLIVARRSLVARAFLPARNRVREVLSSVDRRVFGIEERCTSSGSPAPTDPAQLPGDEPIAWRETSKRWLGRPRHFLLILLLIEAPLLLAFGLIIVTMLVNDDAYIIGWGIIGLIFSLLWLLAVLIVSVRAASLIAGERSHQTLEVLCTTPVTGREILLQKMRAVRRLILLFVVPFATLFCFQVLWTTVIQTRWRYGWPEPYEFDAFRYLVCSALGVAVYLPLTAWVSLLIGLRVRTQARAMIGSLAAIVLGCAAPLVFFVIPLGILFPDASRQDNGRLMFWASLTSPASITVLNEFQTRVLDQFNHPWLAITLNFAAYGALLFVIRRTCLAHADCWLGRSDAEGRLRTEEPAAESEEPAPARASTA